MKRGHKLNLPHILPDDQMEHMVRRMAAEMAKPYVLGSLNLAESDRYYFAYRMLEAAGFKAAYKVNENLR